VVQPGQDWDGDNGTCPFRKSYPGILVVQPGQDWDGDNDTGPLDRATQGRILAQRQVRARLIVIYCIVVTLIPRGSAKRGPE
jgi:hypothetical protein